MLDSKVLPMILAGLCWGTTGTIQSFAPVGTSPMFLGFVRIAVGGLVLALFCGARGNFRLADFKRKTVWLTGAATAFFQMGFFIVLRYSGVSIGTMLCIGSSLIAAGVLDVVRGARPTGLWWFSAVLAVMGLYLMAVPSGGQCFQWPALLFGAMTGTAYAFIGFGIKKLSEEGVGAMERSMLILCSGCLFIMPLAFIAGMPPQGGSKLLAVALGLGLASAAIPYGLFSVALKELSIGQVYVLGLMEPLTAVALGICVVGERPGFAEILGIILMFTSLLFIAYETRRMS